MHPYETLRLSWHDEAQRRIPVLEFHRPEARNALNQQMVDDLHRAFADIESDPDVAVLVLTGSGDRAFVSGADIGELRQRRRDDAFRLINTRLFHRIEQSRLVTIAAIRGFCLGGGNELALACDLRLAGKQARFGQPEVKLGILPGAGATYRLPRIVGEGIAKELIYTGRIIDAAEAHRIGLVNRVVDDNEVLQTAVALGAEIASQAPLAVRLSKQSIQSCRNIDGAAAMTIESTMQAVLFEDEEKNRRMTAFLDRKSSAAHSKRSSS